MKTLKQLQEGLYDPNIFKAYFLAGGPGSGKSYVVKKSTGGTGLKIVNSDDAFEKMLKQAGLSLKMPDDELIPRDKIRDKAKVLTDKRKDNYVEGRLGLVIDGTGKDLDKITNQASDLKQIGYDVHMIFVNTSLDVALANNKKRARTLKDSIVKDSWNAVQKNMGKFQNYFGSRNFIIVDNNEVDKDGRLFDKVLKRVKSMLSMKVNNPAAQRWIDREIQARRR
jgi:cytidylate kinase